MERNTKNETSWKKVSWEKNRKQAETPKTEWPSKRNESMI